MEFGNKVFTGQINRRPSSSSCSNYTNFSDHALEEGLWGGRTVGGGHGGSEILRELEKKRIREEILAEERVLAAGVRREYMMDRDMRGMQSGSGGEFPSSSSFMLGHLDSYHDRFQPRIPHGQSYAPTDTRAAMLLNDDYGGSRRQPGDILSLVDRRTLMPLQEYGGSRRQPDEYLGMEEAPRPKIKEIITFIPKVAENGITDMGKPNVPILSGAKRKQPPPSSPAAGGPTEISSGSKKKTNEWSCAICEVSATSERGLQEHLAGKKHQTKMADLKASHTGKTEKKSVTKNTPESVQLDSNEDKKPEGECSGQKFRFWCRMCKTGASNKKEINIHKKGVTHLKNQLNRAQKSRRKAGGRSGRI